MNQLLSTAEAARRLGLRPKTIAAYLHAGLIEGRKLGDGRRAPWLVSESALERFSAVRRPRGRPPRRNSG